MQKKYFFATTTKTPLIIHFEDANVAGSAHFSRSEQFKKLY